MSNLDDMLDEAFGKKKPKIVEVAIKRGILPTGQLYPPPNVVVDFSAMTGNKPTIPGGIDFSYLANNSSFQRGIMEFIKRFVPGMENIKHRGSKEVMKQSFNQNAHNYKQVMTELKEKLKQRKDEIDGF